MAKTVVNIKQAEEVEKLKQLVDKVMGDQGVVIRVITPSMATKMLELNQINRPLSDHHVARIAQQIKNGLWRFNGDSIKIAKNNDVLDGQHRLWACIMADTPIKTVIVRDIDPNAFSTIDTLRKPRAGADVLALAGLERYRRETSAALTWLLRFQRKLLPSNMSGRNRIENSDIEDAWAAHPSMVDAVSRVYLFKKIIPPSQLGCLFYQFSNRHQDKAEEFVTALEDTSGLPLTHPAFVLRQLLVALQEKKLNTKKDSLYTMAVSIKAWNAFRAGKKIGQLKWRRSGTKPEGWPTID